MENIEKIFDQTINKELDELINIICNNEIIQKQVKANSFDDFKKSRELRKLINEFAVSKFEKYAINGQICETKEGKILTDLIGNLFLNIFYK